ncbi:MAG: hypothetical protein ACOC1P_03205 [Minisyncoccales bacterium]
MKKMIVFLCIIILCSLFFGVVGANNELEEESALQEEELARKKIELLKKKLRVINLEIKNKENKTKRLEEKISSYEEKLNSKEVTDKEIEELKEEIENLENNYAGIQKELRNLRIRKYQYEKEIEDLKKQKWKSRLKSNFSIGIGLIRGEQDNSIIEIKYLTQKIELLASFQLVKKETKWWEKDKNEYQAGSLSFVGAEREIFKKDSFSFKGGILYLNKKGVKPSLSTEITRDQFFLELRMMGISPFSYTGVIGFKF